MQEQKTATLTTIFSEVLASLAFMFTDEDMVEPSPGELWLETTVTYQGPSAGTLRLRCTSEFSILLAANLLGIDPQDEQARDQARDAIGEFMNIVCGQLVTAVHGTDDVFNLSIPKTCQLSEMPELTLDDSEESTTLCVDGHLVQLSYLTQEEDKQMG